MAQLLTSWKEIAKHFGKGVRTVQRWEFKLGLPVHRPDSGAKNIVFAIPEELNLWVVRSSRRFEIGASPETDLVRQMRELELENATLRQRINELSGEQNLVSSTARQSPNQLHISV